ncbi:hypothetical protein CUZ89_0595 [Enterococcus xinjiangensis]|nr:hypothetical protein [Enterococcus lactis]
MNANKSKLLTRKLNRFCCMLSSVKGLKPSKKFCMTLVNNMDKKTSQALIPH